MFSFPPLIINSVTIGLSFFITKHISSNIIKNNQDSTFSIWILFLNIFMNIIHIIRVFNKIFRIF